MIKQVTPEEVANRLQNGEEVTVIDVREKSEVATGKIPGAKHMPIGLLALRKAELDKNKSYIVTCQSGNRSKVASGLLEVSGFKVEDMIGGMNNSNGMTE